MGAIFEQGKAVAQITHYNLRFNLMVPLYEKGCELKEKGAWFAILDTHSAINRKREMNDLILNNGETATFQYTDNWDRPVYKLENDSKGRLTPNL